MTDNLNIEQVDEPAEERRVTTRPGRLMVRTSGFQLGNRGSIPLRDAK